MKTKFSLFTTYVCARLQVLTAADITVQISINNTIWFEIKGVNKWVQAHLASQIQSTDGCTASLLLWKNEMLMSIHHGAQSHKNQVDWLIFFGRYGVCDGDAQDWEKQ